MSNPNHLRSIKTFPDLARYLEEELDWPLQAYGFDELTFEYAPAELGLKDADAAAVKTIHQLRPMVDGQPFGERAALQRLRRASEAPPRWTTSFWPRSSGVASC